MTLEKNVQKLCIVEALKKIPIWNFSQLIAESQLNTMRRHHTSRRDEKILLLFMFIFPCNTASLASEVVAERARPGVEFLEINVEGSRGLQFAGWMDAKSEQLTWTMPGFGAELIPPSHRRAIKKLLRCRLLRQLSGNRLEFHLFLCIKGFYHWSCLWSATGVLTH